MRLQSASFLALLSPSASNQSSKHIVSYSSVTSTQNTPPCQNHTPNLLPLCHHFEQHSHKHHVLSCMPSYTLIICLYFTCFAKTKQTNPTKQNKTHQTVHIHSWARRNILIILAFGRLRPEDHEWVLGQPGPHSATLHLKTKHNKQEEPKSSLV